MQKNKNIGSFNEENKKKISGLFKTFEKEKPLIESLDGMVKLVGDLTEIKQDVINTVDEKIQEVDTAIEGIQVISEDITENANQAIEYIQSIKDEAIAVIKEIKQGEPGKDGINADEEKVIKAVLAKMPKGLDEKTVIKKLLEKLPTHKASLKVIQEKIEVDPMSVIEKIMALPEEKRKKLKLSYSNISGLDQTISAFRNQLGRGYLHGGGASLLSQLQDVTITNPTAGDLLQYNGTKWINTAYDDNGILSINGLSGANQFLIVGTSGSDFNISSVTNTHTFNLPTASATVRGALSTTDWSTFNSKVTSVSGTAGNISSTGGTTPVIDLITTAVTPGSYTNTNLTIDAYGRITSAASGSPGGVTSLNSLTGAITLAAGTGMSFGTVGNTITINSTADLSVTLADVSANSTTTPLSLYTMTSTIPVEFRRSGGNTLLYLDESNALVKIGAASALAGKLSFNNATNAFTQSFRGTNPSASIIYDLPTTAPTAGQFLSSTAPSGGVATLSWETISVGITIGSTTITGGADTQILYNNTGVVSSEAAFTYDYTNNALTVDGTRISSTGTNNVFMGASAGNFTLSGTGNTGIGDSNLSALTSATNNTVVGYLSGNAITQGGSNTIVGEGSGTTITTGTNNVVIGVGSMTHSSNAGAAYNICIGTGIDVRSTTGYNINIGYASGLLQTGYYGINIGIGAGGAGTAGVSYVNIGAYAGYDGASQNGSIAIGSNATSTAANQLVIGGGNVHGADGTISTGYIGNGVVNAAPQAFVLNATGGSGSNIAGASFTLAGGKGTGTGTPGVIIFQTSVVGTTGTTLQSLSESGRFINNQGLWLQQNSTTHSVIVGQDAGNSTMTGINNSLFGYQAGKALTSGYNSVLIGYQAGVTLATQYENTIIGSLAGTGTVDATFARQNTFLGYSASLNTKGSQNVVIGSEAGNGEQNYNTVIGWRARFNATSTQDGNTIIGNQSGSGMNGNYNTYLGYNSGNTATGSYSIALGANVKVSASNVMVTGGPTSTDALTNHYYNGITSTTPQSIVINAVGGSGSDIAGASLTIAGGKGTGAGAAGTLIFQTADVLTTGTTLQSLTTKAQIIARGQLQIRAGLSSGIIARAGGVIFDHFTDAGNTGTGEDDLYTDTLPASILGTNGDKITATYAGIFVGAAASTQDLRLYFGGTKIYDSGALSIGVATDNWTVNVECIRVSSSVVRCTVWLSTDFGTLFPYSTYTEVTGLTLTNTQVLKITGEAAGVGAADNQIVAKLGHVEWLSSSS